MTDVALDEIDLEYARAVADQANQYMAFHGMTILGEFTMEEISVFGHDAPFPAADAFFRYASMNGSMSPSITRCTSGIFNSVRWSLTMVYG